MCQDAKSLALSQKEKMVQLKVLQTSRVAILQIIRRNGLSSFENQNQFSPSVLEPQSSELWGSAF